MKNRLGVLAYVITTLQSLSDFDSLRLAVDIEEGGRETTAWTGEALCVLIGNGRRFTTHGSTQANIEDGLFEAVVVEDVSALDLMGDAVLDRLLGEDSAHIVRSRTPSVTISSREPEPIRFSLDGEIIQQEELSLSVRSQTLRLAVGDTYDPYPD